MIRRAARLALLVAGLVTAGELVVRQLVTSPSNQVPHRTLGWVYRPNSTIFRTSEGGAHLRLNAIGLNDDALRFDKPTTVVVGDSFTEALQVPRSDNFISHLNNLLPERRWINAGRSGLGPAEYRAVIERVNPPKPFGLLLALGRGDGYDLIKASVSEENGALKTKPSGRDGLRRRLAPILERSALVTHLARRFQPVVQRWRTGSAHPTIEPKDHQETVRRRLRIALADLATMAPLHVTYIPELSFETGGRVTNLRAWEQALIESVCAELGLPFTDLLGPLQEDYRRRGQPGLGFNNGRVGFGHLNPEGHRAVAEALAAGIGAKR